MNYLLIFLCAVASLSSKHAITFKGGHRFGDQVSCYMQARYFSELFGLPFLHRPFLYSEQLITENRSHSDRWKYKKIQNVLETAEFLDLFHRLSDATPTLFQIFYRVDDLSEWETFATGTYLLNYEWNADFLADLRSTYLLPKIPIPQLTKPGMLNVAAHVRILSGGDTPEFSFLTFPLRHPNTHYHKRQIERIYEWNLKKPMHVFLFSDTKQPLHLLADFRKAFEGTRIEFGIRNLEKVDEDFVIEDFFAMQQFDVLISTQSSFSKSASKLGAFDMVFYPIHCKKRPLSAAPQPTEIDQVRIVSRKSEWFPFALDFIVGEES